MVSESPPSATATCSSPTRWTPAGSSSGRRAQTDGGDLSVHPCAALASSAFGMRAVVDDTAGLFVQDDTPNDENRYRARFYVDPNGFDPGEAAAQRRTRVFIALRGAAARRLVAIVLRRHPDVYALMARVGRTTTRGATPPSPPSATRRTTWRSTGSAAHRAGHRRRHVPDVDRRRAGGHADRPRQQRRDRLRAPRGADSVKSAANGTIYLDEFVSRRANPIGPVN